MGSMTQREKLQMITEAVKRAERGDYSVTVPVQGTQDPLDTLCREINSFLASVHRRLTECSSTEDALREKAGRYRLLAENATDIIFTMDLDLRFTFISPSVERLRGYTVEEAMAQSPGDALTPASLEKAMTAFAEEMNIERSGTGDLHRTRTLELEERCKDGSVIWTETTFSPLRDEQNNAIGFMGITRDVTQRKRAQEALDLSRAQLQAVIDASLDAITVTDGNGTFLASNKVLQERWGKSRDEIVGHSAAEVLTPGVFANRLERVRRCIATGRSDHFTDRRDDAWFENTIAPIVEPDGRIRTVAMFSRDITERKRAEDRLVSLSQQLNDIIELIPDATFVIDQDKRVIAWNRATEEMTGARKESMLGRGDYEYAVPFFGERKPILIDLLDEPDTKIEAFYKYVHRQGDKIYAESYIPGLNGGRGAHLWGVAAPLYDRDGNRFGSIEVIRDVTANVLKEEERLRSERKYREILEQIDDGYYEVDLEGTFTFFNNAMCRILKYTPEDTLVPNSMPQRCL